MQYNDEDTALQLYQYLISDSMSMQHVGSMGKNLYRRMCGVSIMQCLQLEVSLTISIL